MNKLLILLLGVTLLSGCVVKYSDESVRLGDEVSLKEIQKAFDDAQSGVPQEKLFRLGDKGFVQEIDRVLGNSTINSTYEYKVEEFTEDKIYYSVRNVETNQLKVGYINRIKAAATNSEPSALLFIKKTLNKIAGFFKKIEINKTSAIGDSLSVRPNPSFLRHPISLAREILEKNLTGVLKTSDNPTPETKPSKYYGLSVIQHPYETENCSQIPGCKVTAVKIEYNEVRYQKDGSELKLRWLYEISKEVPGLFTVLEECFSTVLVEGSNHSPFTRCIHVKNFSFGGN